MSASELRQFGQLVVTPADGSLVVNFNCVALVDEVLLHRVGHDLMRVVELAAQMDVPFTLSFCGVETISSALIGKMILVNKKARACGVRWHMHQMSPPVAEVFRRFGFGGEATGVFARLTPPPKDDNARAIPPSDDRGSSDG